MELTTPHRPTAAQIDLRALRSNFAAIQAYLAECAPERKVQVMPILKANAYGHGLIECALTLEAAGAASFGVAFLEEGIALREAGVRIPILALGGVSGRQIELFLQHRIDLTASSVSKLELIDETAGRLGLRARVHFKIDTGMERIGVHFYSSESLLTAAARTRHCDIIGIFSHFACSDSLDSEFTKLQLERFLEVCSFFPKHSLPTPTRHISNSAGMLSSAENLLDLVRPGATLYGIAPAQHLADVIPVTPCLRLRSEVAFFKVVPKGAPVGYGSTWHAPRQTRLVTVPIGYGDGYLRAISNRGQVLIRGVRYPIVGTVCMDQLMVDIGPDGVAYNGDEVVLLGEQLGSDVSLSEVAEWANTDPREILTMLNSRIPRVYTGMASV